MPDVLGFARVLLDEGTALDDAFVQILGARTAQRLRGIVAERLTAADVGDPCPLDLGDLPGDRTV